MDSPRLVARAVRYVRALLRQRDVEREMDDEMRYHVEQEIAEHIARGMDPAEARRRALVDFGGIEVHKEAARDASGVRLLQDFVQDARYAVRTLLRAPAFTATAVFTLALGIAGTTVVMSAMNTLFFRPLPVDRPRELFVIDERSRDGWRNTSMGQPRYTYEHLLEYRDAAPRSADGVGGFDLRSLSARTGTFARTWSGAVTSGNYFALLGLRPALGRFYDGDQDAGRPAPEMVIGDELWRREFGGDPNVIGRVVFIDSRPMTIVGVAPATFRGNMLGVVTDAWVPAAAMRLPASTEHADSSRGPPTIWLTLFMRLRSSASLDAANAEFTRLGQTLQFAMGTGTSFAGGGNNIAGVRLEPLNGLPAMAHAIILGFGSMLLLTATFVLLIATTNVAGMLLARGAYRRQELAVRLAVGAGRGRVVRQLCTEGVLLCAAGALGAVLLARALIAVIPSVQPPIGVRTEFPWAIDSTVLTVTAATVLLAALLAGLAPALASTRSDLLSLLRGIAGGQRIAGTGARSAFVVAQLSLSLVLLFAAGLFSRAVSRALEIEPGLDPTGVVTARVDLSPHGYDRAHVRLFYGALLDQLRANPTVIAAGIGANTPLNGGYDGEGILLPGESGPRGRRLPVMKGYADPGYFAALRIPIIDGRAFDATDGDGRDPVVVVNETLARAMWPNANPLGKPLKVGGAVRTVVGVARNGRYRTLTEGPESFAFIPIAQVPRASALVYVKTRASQGEAVAIIRAAVSRLDPNVALEEPSTVADQLAILSVPQKLGAWAIGSFGVLGLVLALVGIYGVLAFEVAQRTREFGIRLALGASPGRLVASVIARAARLVGVATLIGLAIGVLLGFAARAFLLGVVPFEPAIIGTVPLLFVLVALVASYLPARRAAAVDPLRALKAE